MAKPEDRRPKRNDQEALVDRLLRQLPHADPSLGAASQPTTKTPVTPRPATPRPPPPKASPLAVWGRVLLGVVLASAMLLWPYAAECGFKLAGYLAAVAVVLTTGVWASWVSWREHLGWAHLLAQLVVLWGLVLGAERILPRVGYARVAATWSCNAVASPAAAAAGVPIAAPIIATDTVAPDTSATPADSQRAARDSAPR